MSASDEEFIQNLHPMFLKLFPLKNWTKIFKDIPESSSTVCSNPSLQEKLSNVIKDIASGKRLQLIDKYKLNDFENFSPVQRLAINFNNKDFVWEASEVVTYIIGKLGKISASGFTQLETYDSLIQLLTVLKIYAEVALISNGDMIRICMEMEKFFSIFSWIRKQHIKIKNSNTLWEKETKLFYTLIKMLNYFVYCFNDRIFKNILINNTKYPDVDSITFENTQFLYNKTDIGTLIARWAIRWMSIIKMYYKSYSERAVYIKINRWGMKLLSYLWYNYDSYLWSLNKILKNGAFYLKVFQPDIGNTKISKFTGEQNKVTKAYIDFFNKKIEESEMMSTLSKSLDSVLGENVSKFDENSIAAIWRTNYFWTISKVFNIVTLRSNNEEQKDLIEKVFKFYNIFITDSSDNALLIISYYIFSAIIKVPNEYAKLIFDLFYQCIWQIEEEDSVLSYSKHLLVNIFDYLIRVHKEGNIPENTMEQCLWKQMMIMESLVIKIKCWNGEIIIHEAKNILTILNKTFRISEQYYASTNNRNTDLIDEIFYYFIHISNLVYDSSNWEDRESLSNLFTVDKIISYLRNKEIYIRLKIRAEMLVFLRKILVDIPYYENEHQWYANSIISCEDKWLVLKSNPWISNFQYPTKWLSFNKDIYNPEMKNTKDPYFDTSSFDLKSYNVWIYEWSNLESIVKEYSEWNEENCASWWVYFEKGLILPIITYLQKSFTVAHWFTGEEMLNIYDMISMSLDMKIFISGYKKNFWEDDNPNNWQEPDQVHITKGYNELESTINGTFCVNDLFIQLTKDEIKNLKNQTFSPYDYTILFQIVNTHLFSLVNDTPLSDIAEDFEEEDIVKNWKGWKNIEQRLIKNYEEGKTDIDKRWIRAYFIYKIDKETISDDNSCLFSCLPEICLEFETNFRNLLINLLLYNGQSLGIEEEYTRVSFYWTYKLLSLQTTETQFDIIAILGGWESEDWGFMSNYSHQWFNRLIWMFIDYNHPRDTVMNVNYYMTYNWIKIFKFWCEEHNNFFQGRLMKNVFFSFAKTVPSYFYNFVYKTNKKELESLDNNCGQIKFFDFFLHVLTKIILISKWEKHKMESDEHKHEYFYDLFAAIWELLIEIIQGNKPEFLSKIGNQYWTGEDSLWDDDELNDNESENDKDKTDSFQKFVESVIDWVFRDEVSSEWIFQIKNQWMQFFTAIWEEKNCNEEVQKFIIKFLNINKVLTSINSIWKAYYWEKNNGNSSGRGDTAVKNNSQIEDNNTMKNNDNGILNPHLHLGIWNLNRQTENLKFNHSLYTFFKHEYFYEPEFSKSNEFELANIFYRYIKLISVQGKSEEGTELINKVSNISESDALRRFTQVNSNKEEQQVHGQKSIAPINLINENVKNFNASFIEKFYIVKFFECITETVEVRTGDKNAINQTVIFTVLPEMIYLSEGTKVEFVAKVNRDSETTKKNDWIHHVEYFQKEIKYYQKRKDFLSRLLARIDFTYIQIFVYWYAVCLNWFMWFTLEGDIHISWELPAAREDGTETTRITNLINSSIDEWAQYYDIITYLYVMLNAFFIILWIFFRMPWYYRIDKIKYMETFGITDKSRLTIWNKIRIAFVDTIYERDYITTLLYTFIISLVGAIWKRGEIAYAFLLLAIINLNPTLKNIIVSIKMKYLELVLTFLLAFILMFIYANLGFFFFNEDFEIEIDGKEDNFCTNLVFCFLSVLDYGLRNRGGVGDIMSRISFKRNTGRYMERFFYDVTFFLLIVIIMIDLVFGIIIKSFQELRNEEQKHDNDKKSHCFICHVNRATVEKNRQDFNEHREKTHNWWNYVNYMLAMKFADVHDLNAVNSIAREKLDNKNISWLPTYKDAGKEDHYNKKKDDNEDNLKVEDENINKHLVKEA